ncbi:MAG: dioxygenase [Proteobacteria bacterium]|nr:dioxygenase [Pseudomonadota bacterium]MDA1310343.1 dioxygenase [Pseudomonadota bacterium]
MRDISERSLTEAAIETFDDAESPRAQEVLQALVHHLHAFVREVEPSDAEWAEGIAFLTRTGHLCQGDRQEFILLSDILGVTSLTDLINHRLPVGSTENSVLGPFFVERRPVFEAGADISGGVPGDPLFASMRVLDGQGRPIAGAAVDIWHSDGNGGYDVLMDEVEGTAMRGLFHADDLGRVWFRSILPASYPVPMDGTGGEILRAGRRSAVRPAHLHVLVNAPGYERLTTMLFAEGDPHLDTDPVFGVKSSLVRRFDTRTGVTTPDGSVIAGEIHVIEYDFVLAAEPDVAAA